MSELRFILYISRKLLLRVCTQPSGEPSSFFSSARVRPGIVLSRPPCLDCLLTQDKESSKDPDPETKAREGSENALPLWSWKWLGDTEGEWVILGNNFKK